MKHLLLTAAAAAILAAAPALAASTKSSPKPDADKAAAATSDGQQAEKPGGIFQPEAAESEGVVNVEGQPISYRAVAGTLVVHPKDWDDAVAKAVAAAPDKEKAELAGSNPTAEASMFYVAYFKNGVPSADRPIMFLYNGGPGSSTVWLHMGGLRSAPRGDRRRHPHPGRALFSGQQRLQPARRRRPPCLSTRRAPASPASRERTRRRISGAWIRTPTPSSQFILEFLSKYSRWNSPKYLFGESYGTPRSAVVINQLETEDDVDFNGVVLLSQILNFDLSDDGPQFNPGTDEAYITALPTYAATAWYHNLLPGGRPGDLEAFLKEVQNFADTDYAPGPCRPGRPWIRPGNRRWPSSWPSTPA